MHGRREPETQRGAKRNLRAGTAHRAKELNIAGRSKMKKDELIQPFVAEHIQQEEIEMNADILKENGAIERRGKEEVGKLTTTNWMRSRAITISLSGGSGVLRHRQGGCGASSQAWTE